VKAPIAVAALSVLALGCSPQTTRPTLIPFPEALTNETYAIPPKAIDMLAHGLQDDSIPVRRIEIVDGWLDSGWFEVETQAVATGPFTGTDVVRVRGWADPGRPKYSDLTVEAVYRKAVDPSQPPRDMERALPNDHPVMKRIKRVLDVLGARKGLREAEAEEDARKAAANPAPEAAPATGGPPIRPN
jgi:hypothetical protein